MSGINDRPIEETKKIITQLASKLAEIIKEYSRPTDENLQKTIVNIITNAINEQPKRPISKMLDDVIELITLSPPPAPPQKTQPVTPAIAASTPEAISIRLKSQQDQRLKARNDAITITRATIFIKIVKDELKSVIAAHIQRYIQLYPNELKGLQELHTQHKLNKQIKLRGKTEADRIKKEAGNKQKDIDNERDRYDEKRQTSVESASPPLILSKGTSRRPSNEFQPALVEQFNAQKNSEPKALTTLQGLAKDQTALVTKKLLELKNQLIALIARYTAANNNAEKNFNDAQYLNILRASTAIDILLDENTTKPVKFNPILIDDKGTISLRNKKSFDVLSELYPPSSSGPKNP